MVRLRELLAGWMHPWAARVGKPKLHRGRLLCSGQEPYASGSNPTYTFIWLLTCIL